MKPTVIKYGGSLLEDAEHRKEFLKDIAALSKTEQVVLVHGGGKEITKALESAGIPIRFVGGRRYTDEHTMQVVEKVLSALNQDIVKELALAGAHASGFSGKTNGLMKAQPVAGLGQVGVPQFIEIGALEDILAKTPLPVFYSVAESSTGVSLNVNADDFALALAVACHANRLIFLTDTGGILGSDKKVISYISPQDADHLVNSKVISGGMIVKAQACVRALQEGVGRVDIVRGIKYLFPKLNLLPEGTVFLPGPEKRN